MKVLPLLSILLLTVLLSCEKPGLQLPPVTSQGKNTFGFKIDGEVWVAYSDDFKISQTDAKYNSGYGLTIRGVNTSKGIIEITLSNPKEGVYKFGMSDKCRYIPEGTTTGYELNVNDTGNTFVISKLDQNLIAGTFNLSLRSSTGALIKLTDGRFDVSISQ